MNKQASLRDWAAAQTRLAGHPPNLPLYYYKVPFNDPQDAARAGRCPGPRRLASRTRPLFQYKKEGVRGLPERGLGRQPHSRSDRDRSLS